METGAMCEGRGVVCMTPRIVDRTSRSIPGSIWKSLLMSMTRYGIATGQYSDYTGSVYGRRLKEVRDTLFLEKA